MNCDETKFLLHVPTLSMVFLLRDSCLADPEILFGILQQT